MQISKLIKTLIEENEKCHDKQYRVAYLEGLLDMWNEINKGENNGRI